MSIFGDLETPEGKRPASETEAAEHPAKPLRELSLEVHKTILDGARGKVHVSALARTGFSDGTAGPGVPVGFFLNGQPVVTTRTDEFGLASLEHSFDANLLRHSSQLMARVRGFANEATSHLRTKQSDPQFTKIQQGWLDEVTVRYVWLEHFFNIGEKGFLAPVIYGWSIYDWKVLRVFKGLFISARTETRRKRNAETGSGLRKGVGSHLCRFAALCDRSPVGTEAFWAARGT